MVTAEALVRWQHPERGLLMPGAFLAFAEQSAVMHPLTLRVLDLALAQCARWREEGLRLKVAVNVSAYQPARRGLRRAGARRARRHGLAPGALQLEITEDVVMTDPEKATRVLAELSALGIELAIDDYGTGYSSLAYLKRLPVDELKIDRSFVTHLATDRTDRAIVRSTVELARTLGIRVVAEGVEDAAGAARPLRPRAPTSRRATTSPARCPPSELTDWLRARRRAARPAGAWLAPACGGRDLSLARRHELARGERGPLRVAEHRHAAPTARRAAARAPRRRARRPSRRGGVGVVDARR